MCVVYEIYFIIRLINKKNYITYITNGKKDVTLLTF